MVLFATQVILTGSFRLNISAINASISVADTFLIAATPLFGPAPATVALAIDTFVLLPIVAQGLRACRWSRRTSPRRCMPRGRSLTLPPPMKYNQNA